MRAQTAKVKDFVIDEADRNVLNIKDRKERVVQKREPRFLNKLIKAAGGQVQAAELLNMSGPGINAIVRENKCRAVVELASEYLYKTLYAGQLGEETKKTNDKIIKEFRKEADLANSNLVGAMKYMEDNNFIKAYTLIQSAQKHMETCLQMKESKQNEKTD